MKLWTNDTDRDRARVGDQAMKPLSRLVIWASVLLFIACVGQLALIACKLDGTFDWHWQWVLLPAESLVAGLFIAVYCRWEVADIEDEP